LKIGEAKIAGCEIKLFVIEGIIGNVHFAVFAEEGAVGVENRASIMVNARGAALEKRYNENDSFLLGYFREGVGNRSGNGLGEIKKFGVLLTAEIFAAKELVQRNNLRASGRGFANFVDGVSEILLGIVGTAHLHEPDRELVRHELSLSFGARRSEPADLERAALSLW